MISVLAKTAHRPERQMCIRDRSQGIQIRGLAEEEWHILLHAYFASLAEVVMHNFPKEAALRYVHTLASFFNSGWQTVLGI